MRQFLQRMPVILTFRQKVLYCVLGVGILINSAFDLLGVAAILPFVNVLMDTSSIHTNKYYAYFYDLFKVQSDDQFILVFALLLIAIYVVKNAYIVLQHYFQSKLMFTFQKELSLRLIKCFMYQPYSFHLSKNVVELQRDCGGDVSQFFQAMTSFISVVTEGILCAMMVFFLFMVDKSITIGLVLSLGFFSTIYLYSIKKMTFKFGEETRITDMQSGKWTRQAFEGIKEIKIVETEDFFMKNIEDAQNRSVNVRVRNGVIGVIPKPLFEATCVVGLMLTVCYKIVNGVDLTYFIPVLSAFAVAAFRLMPSFSRLTNQINAITFALPAVRELHGAVKTANMLEIKEKEQLQLSAMTINKEITVENVHFKYPKTDKFVLDGISISIPKDKSVGLMGPSGAGKTTLVDVILGLLDPNEGRVCVDGNDIAENIRGYRKMIGYIPQVIYLMDSTIKENILFGIPESECDNEALERAIDDAQLRDFINELPNGLDTKIGERGVRISGGQRQRIGIARALYSNPSVLILDEATASLDNETEAAVMEAINGLQGKKTIIIIAHRLSTIKKCDIIYKVADGKVADVTEDKVNF